MQFNLFKCMFMLILITGYTESRTSNSLKNDNPEPSSDVVQKLHDFGLQTTIEHLEGVLFPRWLQASSNLSRYHKWLIVLSLELNKYAMEIQKKMKDFQLTANQLAYAIEQFYDQLPSRVAHSRGEVRITPSTDEGWLELYNKVGAKHEFEQQSLKLCLQSLHPKNSTLDPLFQDWNTTKFVFFQQLDHKTTKNHINKLFREVEPKCVVKTSMVYTDHQKKFSGYAVAAFQSQLQFTNAQLQKKLNDHKILKKTVISSVYSYHDTAAEEILPPTKQPFVTSQPNEDEESETDSQDE